MTQHTPGPWEFINPNNVMGHPKIVSKDGKNVCLLAQCTHPVMQANARLIATAPELLEALIQATNTLQRLRDGERGGAVMGACSTLLDDVAAVIAKATGN